MFILLRNGLTNMTNCKLTFEFLNSEARRCFETLIWMQNSSVVMCGESHFSGASVSGYCERVLRMSGGSVDCGSLCSSIMLCFSLSNCGICLSFVSKASSSGT